MLPENFVIQRPYPNPFRFDTQFNIALPTSTGDYTVSLRVFNSQGQLIHSQSVKELKPGYHSLTWDGSNKFSDELAPGMYAYTLQINGETSYTDAGHLVKN